MLVLGPLAECVVDKLVTDFPYRFRRCATEARNCMQAALDQELADNLIIDYKRKGMYYECTTFAAIKTVCDKVYCKKKWLIHFLIVFSFVEFTLHDRYFGDISR